MSSIYYPTSRHGRRPRQRFSIEQALLALFIGLLIFGLSLAALLVGTQVWYAGRIFPGVRVAGVDISGMIPQEAEARIAEQVVFPQQGRILLRDTSSPTGDQIWLATPAELGLYLDPQATAETAFKTGREGLLIERLRTQFYSWYLGHNLAPNLIYDERAAYRYIANLAQDVDTATIEASVSLNGTEVVVTPGQVGRFVDLPASLARVSDQLSLLRDGVVDLVVTDQPPVIIDATAQAEMARAILSQPLTLTMPEAEASQGGPWTIEPATLATMLVFERVQTENGMQFQVTLNSEMLRTYLAAFAPELSRWPQNARFYFDDGSREFVLIESAIIGRELDVDKSIAAIQENLYVGVHTIPLTMNYTNPPVTDDTKAADLGITELVHAETSYFYGSSASRVQNIETAASKFHGVLVPPGATFSMADALGDITLDNGYAEAMIIIGGQTIKGVGGGVCQVSTTLFRAAFFSGFPIVERHAHAYRVYYYEKVAGNRIDSNLAGLDATVFVPLVDFKFVNDTQNWLLMETYVSPSGSSITWKFYSTKDGRRVEWSTTGVTNVVPAPESVYRENSDLASGEIKQVDWKADGSDVTVTRNVYRNDTIYLQDRIYTHYEPWADVYEYGPGTDLPNDDEDREPPEG